VALKLDSGEDASLSFSTALLQVFRLVRLYDTDNVNFEDPLEKLKGMVITISDRLGSARVQAEEGVLYFNKEPVRGGRRAFKTIQGLSSAFEAVGIAELAFMGALSDDELRAFFQLMRPRAGKVDVPSLDEIKEGVEKLKLKDRVQVLGPGETTSSAQVNQVEIDEASYFPLAYARTLVLLREYVKNLRSEDLNRYFSTKLHRALQELCGQVAKYRHKFIAMASVKGVEDYIFNHMANTGFLAVVLGHDLGISRVQLSDLGLAGMLCALGRFRGPHELLDLANLTPAQAQEDGKHPYRGLAAILEGRKITKKVLVSATVAFQYDLHRGRTPVRIPPTQHPFSMIVRVCEEYDSLTSALPDRPALLPDQALRQMLEEPAEKFDPMVMTVFTNLMGLFPSGTTVTLSSGEIGVVVHPNAEHPKRPLVAIVMDSEGNPVDGDYLDLAEKVNGAYPSSITGSIDPNDLGISVPDYLLA
jgi:HD-GYP domain-containing protein (c-di-GMP phosphodiesterase class II)